MATDEGIVDRIDRLIDEEQRLREHGDSADHDRIEAIEVELDQCWDLLRQRRAEGRSHQHTQDQKFGRYPVLFSDHVYDDSLCVGRMAKNCRLPPALM